MELSMEQGSLVWVQRKNGKWWPGKLQLPSSSSKTAVRLLGRERGSLEWFNLEKSTRVKAFRSVEFVDFIKKVESSHTSHHKKKSDKYAHHEDAVLHALLIEKQEQGELRQEDLSQAKRRRCSYQPCESIDNVKQSALPSETLQVNESSDKSDITERSFQDSDSSGLKKGCLLIGRSFQDSGSGEKDGLKKGYMPSASTYDPSYTMLFNVDVAVQGSSVSSRKVHVPLVSLMSKLNNVAIIGHPLEVEVLESTKRSTNLRLDGLMWKTAKRTKVCYIPKSSASSKLEANANANGAVQDEEEALLKPVMKGKILSDEGSCVPVSRIFSRLISELSR